MSNDLSNITPPVKSDPGKAAFTLLLACTAALLTACVATGPYPGVPILGASPPPLYKGPVAAPQVAYRIDENRFFEIVPREDAACYRAGIFYTDKAQGIHTSVMGISQLGGVDLVIDAANTQYLVAPIIKGGGSCYNCGGSWLPYSVDGGRSWELAVSYGEGVQMSGERVYTGGASAKVADLVKIKRVSDLEANRDVWTKGLRDDFSKPIKPPLDTKFHCTPNGKE